MKKRMLSVLLAALLVASATLVSCSTDDDTNENKTQGSNETKTADATDSSNTMTRYELIGTDGEGDVVSEAVWQRNLVVEERCDRSTATGQ